MIELDYSDLKSKLESAKHIVITCHRSPDGDAIGSTLGLQQLLASQGIDASVIIPDPAPGFLHWMKGYDAILIHEQAASQADALVRSADVIFSLDYNHFDRAGGLAEALTESNGFTVLIDHHIDPSDAFDFILSDTTASSTSELVYRLTSALGWQNGLNADSAACLYAGIMTDTGSFRFSSTSAETHRVVADLMDHGLKPELVHGAIFDNSTYDRLQLVGYALSKKFDFDALTGVSVISLSLKEKNRFKYQKGDTEGLVNYGLSVQGARMAIFLSEELDGTKCSLRSKGEIDVNQIARSYFNGGGHKNAAGGRLDMPMDEALKYVRTVLNEKIEV